MAPVGEFRITSALYIHIRYQLQCTALISMMWSTIITTCRLITSEWPIAFSRAIFFVSRRGTSYDLAGVQDLLKRIGRAGRGGWLWCDETPEKKKLKNDGNFLKGKSKASPSIDM